MDEDKPSIMSTLEEDEMIAFDLGEEDAYDDDGEGLLRMDKSLFTIDSLFIVVYEEEGNMVDKLLLVRELIDENNSVQFKDENDNDDSSAQNSDSENDEIDQDDGLSDTDVGDGDQNQEVDSEAHKGILQILVDFLVGLFGG